MRNVLCKFVEGIKTHFVLNIFPHPPPWKSCCLWNNLKSMVQPDRP
jgi:hypothetical protein